jgi:hypothetical protein
MTATKAELYDLASDLLEELSLMWEDRFKEMNEWVSALERLEEFQRRLNGVRVARKMRA